MSQIVYLNQEYIAIEEAKISVMDRGFLLADGIYEVIPIYGSHPYLPDEHYARLLQNLAKINLDANLSYTDLMTIIDELVKKNDPEPMQSLYLQITRGVSWERKQFITGLKPTIFAKLERFARIPGPNSCMTAITVEDWRWGRCDIKGINRLGNVLMAQVAYSSHVDEAIILDHDYVLEGASSNVFIVEGNVVITPPLSDKVLSGVTRKMVIDLVKTKYALVEEPISRKRLFDADEVWITSSTREVAAIIEIDGQQIGKGVCGPIALDLQGMYRKCIDEIVQKNYNS